MSGNTATELTVSDAWETTPDATSQYEVSGANTGRFKDDGYIWVYCERPLVACEPPARSKKLWVLDCNLECTRGGSPGNSTVDGSPNNGDGSVQARAAFDSSDDVRILLVALNDDDDDRDVGTTPDREQSGPVPAEDDLAPLRFQFTHGLAALQADAAQADKGTVTIRVAGNVPDAYGDHPRLKLWKSESKEPGDEIALTWDGAWYSRQYDLASQWGQFTMDLWDVQRDRTLHVEGYEASQQAHDAVVELELKHAGRTAVDVVRYTVLPVSVTLGTIEEDVYTPVGQIQVQDELNLVLIAQVTVPEPAEPAAPDAVQITVRAADTNRQPIAEAPPYCAPVSKTIVAYRVDPSPVPGHITYRSTDDDAIVPWPHQFTGAHPTAPYIYIADDGHLLLDCSGD